MKQPILTALQMRNTFRSFLKNRGIYEKWKECVSKFSFSGIPRDIDEYLKKVSPQNWLMQFSYANARNAGLDEDWAMYCAEWRELLFREFNTPKIC